MGSKLSVIVPVFNEAPTIEGILRRVAAVEIDKEVIVVDDGSTDGTVQIIRDLTDGGNLLAITPIFHDRNQGKGAAIRTAIQRAAGSIVTIQDADLEYHPEDWPVAIRLIEDGYADAVYGSRFLGPHRCFLVWHYLANKVLTWITNVLYNTILTDMETGFKLIRADVLRSLGIRSESFDFEVEVTAKLLKRGYRLYEIPITYTGRSYQEGKKITWKDGIRAFIAAIRFRFVD